MTYPDSRATKQGEMPTGSIGGWPNREANHFILEGENKQIDFSADSITGKPILSYSDGADPSRNRSFTGDEIDIIERPFGKLVTVTLHILPDVHIIYLALLIPKVYLPEHSRELPVETTAVISTHRTPFVGPSGLGNGLQVDTYETLELSGTADFIFS
jgi:hypothetical protein